MIVALMKEVEFLVEAQAGCETEGEIKREITFNFSISVSFSEKTHRHKAHAFTLKN